LGLIINELVTNSLKYAFPKTDAPRLRIKINEREGSLWVEVGDNGPGLPEGSKPGKSKSFGLKLIGSLLKQLKGTMEVQSGPGQGTLFIFEIKNYQLH
jgi:two-component sensor histidine kinase